jgi:hypothetical protein
VTFFQCLKEKSLNVRSLNAYFFFTCFRLICHLRVSVVGGALIVTALDSVGARRIAVVAIILVLFIIARIISITIAIIAITIFISISMALIIIMALSIISTAIIISTITITTTNRLVGRIQGSRRRGRGQHTAFTLSAATRPDARARDAAVGAPIRVVVRIRGSTRGTGRCGGCIHELLKTNKHLYSGRE